jgi:uncharacterized integral membrane protein (TIGR00698 family)
VEPDPLGEPAHGEGDARAADGLPVPVPAARRIGALLPGLALAGVATAVALGLAELADWLPPLVVCVGLGVALANLGLVPPSARAGLAFAGGTLLRAGVVLLGFDLAFPDVLQLGAKALAVVVTVVAITFAGTLWAGRRLGVPENLSLLTAVGFSICGVSAIAAANGVVEADEDEVAYAVALVTLCGTLAIVTLPLLREPLGLDAEAYGAWVGASVHDVGQVVATSSTAGAAALATAIVVKLTRVLLLAPLVAGLALLRGDRARVRGAAGVPLFLLLFVGAIAVASTGVLSDEIVDRIDDVRTVVLGAALFALGTRVSLRRLVRIGPRPLTLGLASWALIAAVAYAGVRLAAV